MAIDCVSHTVYITLKTHLLCSWKFVPLSLPHLLLPSRHPPPFWQPSIVLWIYNSVSILLSLFLCFLIPHISEVIQHMADIPLSVTPSRSMHVVTKGKQQVPEEGRILTPEVESGIQQTDWTMILEEKFDFLVFSYLKQ